MEGIASTLQNLVSALGGRDPTEPGNPYVLGDEGLGCLRDIKRWLQHYDEKKDVWDVKSALAAMNVVSTDLCPILESWSLADDENEHQRRISLACVEILVPLTWPVELGQDADAFKIKQFPNLRLAQSGYKRSILFNPEKDVLSTIMRVAYPSLAIPRRNRTERDSGIIRLVVYLLRNLAAIDGDHNRSDTILAFQKANALEFLCALASGMGEEFVDEDVIVLDIVFQLLRGVEVATIFDLSKSSSDSVKTELSDLLNREKDMKTNNKKLAHTRHNRFGTMVSVVQNSRRFTVASQTAIVANLSGNNFAGIEASKKWNKPQRTIKSQDDVDLKVKLNTEAKLAVSSFTGVFFDSCFNPLFSSVLRAIEQDNSRVSQVNRIQFLYLQGWFFRALREQGQAKQKREKTGADFGDDADYQLIASMMESRATIMLRKMLRESIESKLWKETHAAMDCLRELLMTIHSMSMSSNLEYQDIAENLQSNLYYEESNLELIATCVRTYSNQSLGYLNACTDLATVLLKMLEKYASTRSHMFVRARRQRQRKKDPKQAAQTATADSDDEMAEANARDAVKERAFSFARFEHKFVNDHSVDTFVALLEFYADLSSDQIKRAINFLHRVFVKQKVELLLFRLEIFELLNRMVQDHVGLPVKSPARLEVENFTTYMFKRFTRVIQDCPALAWEILFEKLSNETYYLTHDANKAPAIKKAPRPPAEFEVRPGLSHEDQIKVAVGALLDHNKVEFLDWLKSSLADVLTRRFAWQAEQRARQESNENEQTPSDRTPASEILTPLDEEMKLLLFKNGQVRLLMKLVSMERLGERDDVDAVWIVPSTLSPDQLDIDLNLIKRYTHNPPTFEDDKTASDFIRRQVQKRDSYNTDSSSSSSELSEDSDGFTLKASKTKKRKPKPLRKKEVKEIDYEEIEARRLKRKEMEEERKGNIKSSKYVHDSEDEDDETANAIFFAAEAALRERQQQKASRTTPHAQPKKSTKMKKRTTRTARTTKGDKRRKITNGSSSPNRENRDVEVSSDASRSDEDQDGDGDQELDSIERSNRFGSGLFVRDESDDEDDRSMGHIDSDQDEDKDDGDKSGKRSPRGRRRNGNALFVSDGDETDEEDEGRGRGGEGEGGGRKRVKVNSLARRQKIIDSEED